MNNRIRSLFIVGLTMAAGAAYADGHVRVDINPFGWGAPPPVVYESPRYYAPPPVVYQGRGHYYGERGEGRDRNHYDRGRGEREHHDDGDRRR
jgi:hypothetical protein